MADVDFKKPSVPLIQAAECKKPRPEYKSVIKVSGGIHERESSTL